MSAVANHLAAAIAEHSHDYDAEGFINGTVPGSGVHNCLCDEEFATRDEWATHVAEVVAGMTAPLPQRLREAAETIEQINAMSGMGLNCSVSPIWLRREADVMEREAQP